MSRQAPPALVLLLAHWLAEPAVARALAGSSCRALAVLLRLSELRVLRRWLWHRLWPQLASQDLAVLLARGWARLQRLDLPAAWVEATLRQLAAGLRARAPRAALVEALCALEARGQWLESRLSPVALDAWLLQLAALCQEVADTPAHPLCLAALARGKQLAGQLSEVLARAQAEGCSLAWLRDELRRHPALLQRGRRYLTRGQRALRQDLSVAEGRLPRLLAQGLVNLGQALQAQPDYCALLDQQWYGALCRLDRALALQWQGVRREVQACWQALDAKERQILHEALHALLLEGLALLPAELRERLLQRAAALWPAA
ncbi:DUF445 domain-containing protein [Pseudomonas sp. NW5]|uniref:DUF445 domain-containing protein n=1 Tax=Pseudomonas sp. NW5 TaxID=2934934 RepID=UPI00201FCAE7|nr:DUF445 domain-containing protein [Pseudomonas sp. NW5]MCL7462463.1 DUF445 domain-containing protein [Pseudomonas sp. NW5]